jgi:acetoin:2,6-dichlorophenolindophenol oxidoreductase subunit beta
MPESPAAVGLETMSFAQAINAAIRREMEADDRVILMGEDVGHHGGIFGVTAGLLDTFGPGRVIDTPISEQGIAGAAVGAAIAGLRPVLEIMFNDFMTLAMDQLTNEAAKLRYMTGGQMTVPLTVRTTHGTARSAAAHHSQSLYVWLCHVPGLKVVLPSSPQDAYGLMRSAIRDDNPIVFFEDKQLYQNKGEVNLSQESEQIGRARIVRHGDDATVVATGRFVALAVAAAEALRETVDLEVIDPRTLLPLDVETIMASVRRTRRVVVVDGGVRQYGITAEIAATIYEHAFGELDAPIERVAGRNVVIPFSPTLEAAAIPSSIDIEQAIRRVAGVH